MRKNKKNGSCEEDLKRLVVWEKGDSSVSKICSLKDFLIPLDLDAISLKWKGIMVKMEI